METNISILFKNLNYPSFDPNNTKLELEYENRYIEFSYPLNEPLKLTLSKKLIIDKVNMVLSIIELIKKPKVLYRGTLVLNKNIFLDSNSIYEKNITLIPTDVLTRDMKKEGKISVEVKILDNFEEWKKNAKNFKRKGNLKNAQNNNNNINNNNNKIVDENKKDEFEDNISLVNISKINEDIIDKQNYENIDELINIDYINQLKKMLEKDYQQILPSDIQSLKNLNNNLYQKYTQLGDKYNEIIKNINSENEYIRQKAIEYFNKYKEQKKKLNQLRVELKNKKSKLDSNIENANQEVTNFKSKIEKFKSEKDTFLSQLPNQGETSANNLAVISSGTNNTEIKMLSDAIKKISSLGYDVIEGAKISDEERKLLSVILGTNLCDNIMGSNNEEKNDDIENMKDDFDFGNKIVALIERDVNELYSRKLINQVKIDQIDAITYSFADSNLEKEVAFKIENNNLFCIDSGESFTVWLLNNFNSNETNTQSQFQKYKSEKENFLSQLPIEKETSANNLAVISSGTDNTEIKMLSEAIKKISSLGYDVIEGAKISDEERKLLSVILGTNLCDNLMGNNEEKNDDMENMKDDFDFGNKIVALIERDVNELYSRKLINQVKIDQIDAITYSFADSNLEKEVAFKIENNNLFCIDSGESFTVWLLNNFKA